MGQSVDHALFFARSKSKWTDTLDVLFSVLVRGCVYRVCKEIDVPSTNRTRIFYASFTMLSLWGIAGFIVFLYFVLKQVSKHRARTNYWRMKFIL